MFENEETARYVLERFLNLNDQMSEIIVAVQPQASATEYTTFKIAVGHIIFEAFDKVIEPICKRYPSLRPPEWTDEK